MGYGAVHGKYCWKRLFQKLRTLRLTVKWLNVLIIQCPHMIIRGIIRSLTKKIMSSQDLKRYMDCQAEKNMRKINLFRAFICAAIHLGFIVYLFRLFLGFLLPLIIMFKFEMHK